MITLSQVLRSYGIVDRWPLNVKLGRDQGGNAHIVISSPGCGASYFDCEWARKLSRDLCSIGEIDVARSINAAIGRAQSFESSAA